MNYTGKLDKILGGFYGIEKGLNNENIRIQRLDIY
jgi:hypothetical protein